MKRLCIILSAFFIICSVVNAQETPKESSIDRFFICEWKLDIDRTAKESPDRKWDEKEKKRVVDFLQNVKFKILADGKIIYQLEKEGMREVPHTIVKSSARELILSGVMEGDVPFKVYIKREGDDYISKYSVLELPDNKLSRIKYFYKKVTENAKMNDRYS